MYEILILSSKKGHAFKKVNTMNNLCNSASCHFLVRKFAIELVNGI